VAFAAVNLGSFVEEGEGFAFKRAGGFAEFFGGVIGDGLAVEVGFGRFENGLDPLVDGVLCDFCEDGESFFGSEPGGGDGGVESDAHGFVGGGLFEEIGLVFDLMAVVAEDIDGGSADAVVLGGDEASEEDLIDLIKAPADPEGFEEEVFVAG